MIIINPGSGPVAEASQELANKAIMQFIRDLHERYNLPPVELKITGDECGGRWLYKLSLGEHSCNVEMPGLEVEKVRYLSFTQNPFRFPRLYVDGNSWLWEYALHTVADKLGDLAKSM